MFLPSTPTPIAGRFFDTATSLSGLKSTITQNAGAAWQVAKQKPFATAAVATAAATSGTTFALAEWPKQMLGIATSGDIQKVLNNQHVLNKKILAATGFSHLKTAGLTGLTTAVLLNADKLYNAGKNLVKGSDAKAIGNAGKKAARSWF